MTLGKRFWSVLAGACLVATAPAMADTTALSSNRTVGNQSFAGALGMDFNVLSSILVTELGVFDSGQDGFAGAVQVGIFDRNTTALVGTSATLTGTNQILVGNQRFFDVTDFVLAPGQYSIVAVGFVAPNNNGNLSSGGAASTIDTGGGLISFVGGGRYGAVGLVWPTALTNGVANQFDAGTFQYVSAVPEPNAALMLLAGLGIVGAAYCRRKHR